MRKKNEINLNSTKKYIEKKIRKLINYTSILITVN